MEETATNPTECDVGRDGDLSDSMMSVTATTDVPVTREQVEEIISMLADGRPALDELKEQTLRIASQNEIVVEHIQLQSQLLGYVSGFSLFLSVALLAAVCYKFFRIFF